MAGKGKRGKGKGAPKKATRQQQQQDAARRRTVPPSAARGAGELQPSPGRPVSDITRPAIPAASPEAASARGNHYLDVAAVRIQDWLARTPGLRFRRGASILLSRATAPGGWNGMLPEGVRWNDEAGHVDGVVALTAGEEVDDADAQKVLEGAARTVAQQMRDLMPHCPVQAVTGDGPSYAEAYAGMAAARREGRFLLDWPPAPPELFLAKPCDQCRQAAATRPRAEGGKGGTQEGAGDLCEECGARWEAGGGTAGSERLAPEPERRLRRALETAGWTVKGFSDNFADMARAGRRDSDDASTQLALVYADGNRVGAFLSEAAATAGGPAKSEIAPMLDRATLEALAAGVRNRFSGWSRPPVLTHLAGGDDLLVSVPATDAWLFALTLLGEFGRRVSTAVGGWPAPVRATPPSLSAGIVFHHVTAPFSDVVRLAEGQLRDAKKATGTTASVAFLDLTADGAQPPPGREPMTLDYLRRHTERFQRTADLPGSRRATLSDLARLDRADEFIARLTGLDNPPLWEFAAGPGATPAAARAALHADPAKRAEVRRALDVARHWHAEPREEPRHEEHE